MVSAAVLDPSSLSSTGANHDPPLGFADNPIWEDKEGPPLRCGGMLRAQVNTSTTTKGVSVQIGGTGSADLRPKCQIEEAPQRHVHSHRNEGIPGGHVEDGSANCP